MFRISIYILHCGSEHAHLLVCACVLACVHVLRVCVHAHVYARVNLCNYEWYCHVRLAYINVYGTFLLVQIKDHH